MDHKINSITFGNDDYYPAIRERFGDVDNGQHTMFNMFNDTGKVNHDLKSDAEDKTQLYFYFIKMIPHHFIDVITLQEWKSYSYSLAHNKKEAPGDHLTGVQIILDYAPIKMILTREKREVG